MDDKRARQRRDSERRASDRRADRLGQALDGISTEEIETALEVRDARIEIRCPSTTKAEIEAAAGRFGLTVTTYLLRLHDLARARLAEDDE